MPLDLFRLTFPPRPQPHTAEAALRGAAQLWAVRLSSREEVRELTQREPEPSRRGRTGMVVARRPWRVGPAEVADLVARADGIRTRSWDSGSTGVHDGQPLCPIEGPSAAPRWGQIRPSPRGQMNSTQASSCRRGCGA